TAYYYIKNLQGDVISIFNANGNEVATYTYDAWGRTLATTDTSGVNISAINPIRYRGYYYDTETGFYFLQTRYYVPEICRFLSADTYVSTGQGILGYNMFAYCLNNPVMYSDETGHSVSAVLYKIGSVVLNGFLGFLSVYIADVITNYFTGAQGVDIFKPTSSLGSYLAGILTAFIPGGKVVNAASRILINIAVPFVVDNIILGNDIDGEKIAISTFMSILAELFSYKIHSVLEQYMPGNYSQFKHKISQFLPNISRQETYTAMRIIGNVIRRTEDVIDFFVGIFSSVEVF
ncbi:MAG: RHS repeat-associated core domain-containing protein, partial [Clostridia bacterium]|nr:RHS repeat-associated core domain-containing protein [Clostridia bacterium]